MKKVDIPIIQSFNQVCYRLKEGTASSKRAPEMTPVMKFLSFQSDNRANTNLEKDRSYDIVSLVTFHRETYSRDFTPSFAMFSSDF